MSQESHSAPIVFLGFDGMDCDIVAEHAAELPTFKALIDGWTQRPTQNPPGLLVGGLWPSFWSASGPGVHGWYCYRQLVPGTYEQARNSPARARGEPFWVELDRLGFRCAAVDVPLIGLHPLTHGSAVVDWGTHDRQLPFAYSPATLAERFAHVGSHPIDGCDRFAREDGPAALVDALLDGVDRKAALLESFLADRPDLLLGVFSESHCSTHHLWHMHDPTHPRHDPALVAAIGGDPLLAVYRRLDHALCTLLSRLPDEAGVMVLLSHGAGPHWDGNHVLDDVLDRLAALHRPPTAWTMRRERVLRPVRGARRRVARRLSPATAPTDLRLIDGTRAWYAVPNNDLFGGIRLNLVGREPHGRVRPGADADAVVQLLRDELLALRNVDTGEPAVVDVLRTDDHHAGPSRDLLPDLLVQWNWRTPINTVESPTVGRVSRVPHAERTGDHRPHGRVFLRNLTPPDQWATPVPVEALSTALRTGVLAGDERTVS